MADQNWEDAPDNGAFSIQDQSLLNDAKLQQINPSWQTGTTLAQLTQESQLKSDAVSPRGAMGIAQVMPDTLKAIEKRMGRKLDPHNDSDAMQIQYEVMKENLQKFKDPWDALRAYNGGWNPGTWGNAETSQYVPKIQAKMQENGRDWEDAPSAEKSPTIANVQQDQSWEDAPVSKSWYEENMPQFSGLPGAGAALTDIIGGIPGMLAGGVSAIGQAISTGSIEEGKKTGEEVMHMLTPTVLAQKAIDALPDGTAKNKIQEYLSSALASSDYKDPMNLMSDIYEKGSKAMSEAVIRPIANDILGFNVGEGQGQDLAKFGFLVSPVAAEAGGRLVSSKRPTGENVTAADKINAAEGKAQTPQAQEGPMPQLTEQMNLFNEAETPATASPYQPNRLSEEVQSPLNRDRPGRQMEMQLEDQPTLFANEEGITNIHPDDLQPLRSRAEELTRAEKEAQGPVQGDLFEGIDQRRFDQYGENAEPRVLNETEFAQTMDNLAKQEGTRFEMPEDPQAAYQKYLDTVSDKQGGLFDRPTIAENFAKLAKDEAVGRMVENNPAVKALREQVEAQQAKIAQMQQDNRPNYMQNQEQTRLENMQAKLDTARDNISDTLTGKDNKAWPYAKDGIIYMNSGIPIPKWITDGIGRMLARAHGVVFKYLNSKINGPRQINGIKDLVHAGMAQFIKKQADRQFETKVNQNANDFIGKDSIFRNNEAVKDFIPSHDKPIEEIKQAAMDAPDASLSKASEQVAQGGQMLTQLTRNPIVKYVFDNFNEATKRADQLVRDNLTNSKNGLRKYVQDMSRTEKGEIHTLMDRNEGTRVFTEKELRDAGFNEKQIAYYNRYREVMDNAYNSFSEARQALGLPEIPKRLAYMAGRFMGDFRQLVYKKGTNEVVGFLGNNTRFGLKTIQKHFEDMNPGQYDFGKIDMQGSDASRGMNRFNGYMEALNMLSKTNADVAKIVDSYQNYLTQDANRLMGMQKHFEGKKNTPVFGAEGKKLWESAEKNAQSGMKAQLEYAQHMFQWSEMQKAASKAKDLLSDPDINKPRAKEIAQNYMNHALGNSKSALANANNSLLNAVSDATGIGPSIFRGMNSFQKSALLSLFLGFFRLPHSVINLTQFFQSNPGVMTLLKSRGLDINALDMSAATAKGLDTTMQIGKDGLLKKESSLKGDELAAYKYAKENGVFNIDLSSHLSDINSPKWWTNLKNMSELNITVPEATIRSASYFTYFHMLKDAGLSAKDAMGAADNMTRYGMVDYRPLERPQIYSNIGFFGDIASTLTRFKMNQLSQYLVSGKEIGAGRSIMPLATLLATSVAFGGLTGMIGYNWANELYKLISKEVFHKPDSLDGLVMRNMNDFAQYGVFSQLGINLSGSFSNADIIPDNPWATLFPTANTLGQMGKSAVEAAYYHDQASLKKFAYNVAPSSFKGIMENMMYTKNGNFYNPQNGELKTRRSDYDQTLRNMAFRPIPESKNADIKAVGQEHLQAQADLRQRVLTKIQHGIAEGTITGDDYKNAAQEFTKLGGDPSELASAVNNYYMSRQRTDLERAQGIPSGSVSSLNRYKTFEEYKKK